MVAPTDELFYAFVGRWLAAAETKGKNKEVTGGAMFAPLCCHLFRKKLGGKVSVATVG